MHASLLVYGLSMVLLYIIVLYIYIICRRSGVAGSQVELDKLVQLLSLVWGRSFQRKLTMHTQVANMCHQCLELVVARSMTTRRAAGLQGLGGTWLAVSRHLSMPNSRASILSQTHRHALNLAHITSTKSFFVIVIIHSC